MSLERHRWSWLALSALLVASSVGLGCTKHYVVSPPGPSHLRYEGPAPPATALSVEDRRSDEMREEFSSGTLGAVLEGMEDEVQFLSQNVSEDLQERGVPMVLEDEGTAPYRLEVDWFRIRNHRASGYSPYQTFTTFRGVLETEKGRFPIAFYYKNGKVPVWSFDEVVEPCYDVPIEFLVREVASKINLYAFGLRSSDETVDELVAAVRGEPMPDAYLVVHQLGYTNNPRAVQPLVELIEHSDTRVRTGALSSLGVLRAVDRMDVLVDAWENLPKDNERYMALKAIGDLNTPESHAFMADVKASKLYDKKPIKEIVDLYALEP